jgi:glycosyltransferase involved in cell wall biosynthesis
MPRVSVVIATHNRAERVVQAIESVLEQTFRDLEILVGDDGSTDDTAERIAAIDGPIHYTRLPRSGCIARVRNEALRHGSGELVALLDDDDCWEPEKLARQVAVLDADPGAGLVYTGFSIVDEEGARHVPQLAPWQTEPGPLLGRLLRECFIHPSTVLFPRALLDRVGGFDESRTPCEDYDLLLRLAPLTRGACIPEPLVRLSRGATMNNSVRGKPEREVAIQEMSIAILEGWLAGGRLDLRQRLRCRTAISNLHVAAARLARTAGDRRRERRHVLSALGRNPLKPRPWRALRLYLRPEG